MPFAVEWFLLYFVYKASICNFPVACKSFAWCHRLKKRYQKWAKDFYQRYKQSYYLKLAYAVKVIVQSFKLEA